VITHAMDLLGVGIYSVTEASRMTAVSPGRIRRWLSGYTFYTSGHRHASPPVWQREIAKCDGKTALSFRDLMEIRCVDFFLRRGVCWKTLRQAERLGRELLGTSHPFSTDRIKTDGHTIFAELYRREKEPSLLDLAKSQHVFNQIIGPFLLGVEFSADGLPTRWWPMARSRRIVIDPQRSFGQPIVNREGVPTRILAQAHHTMGSVLDVADWYRVDRRSVKAAITYEQQLLAA